jgi:hypothetical protein
MSESTSATGISVNARFIPLQFLLYLCKPSFVIDNGDPIVSSWGKSFFSLTPGEHTVSCYFRYVFFPRAAESSTVVHVPPNQVVELIWKAPLIVTSPGKWTMVTGGYVAPTEGSPG